MSLILLAELLQILRVLKEYPPEGPTLRQITLVLVAVQLLLRQAFPSDLGLINLILFLFLILGIGIVI